MVGARVYVKHVWRRGDISHHQPMNWCDSIWSSDNRHTWGCSHCGKLRSVSSLWKITFSQRASRAQTHQRSTSNNELSKWLLQNARKGETRQRTSRVSKWVEIIPNVAIAGLYAIPVTSHQISGNLPSHIRGRCWQLDWIDARRIYFQQPW